MRRGRVHELEPWRARIARPARARVLEALEVIDPIGDPVEAWEALAARGLVPHEWVGAEARRFAERCDEAPPARRWTVTKPLCPRCFNRGAVYHEHPFTLEMAVSLASDAPGVHAAEALAREAAERLVPWGGRPAPLVVWKQARPWGYDVSRTLGALSAVARALAARSQGGSLGEDPWSARPSWYPVPADRLPPVEDRRYGAWSARLGWLIDLASRWAAACALGLEVRVAPVRGFAAVACPAIGRPFAELSDPIAPLLDLWSVGYALAEWDEFATTLMAPDL